MSPMQNVTSQPPPRCVSWDFDSEGIYTVFAITDNTSISDMCYIMSYPIQLVWLLYVAEWTTEGCETDLGEVDGVVTCNCNHLTNFAVLVVSIPSVCVCVCVYVCVCVCIVCVCVYCVCVCVCIVCVCVCMSVCVRACCVWAPLLVKAGASG